MRELDGRRLSCAQPMGAERMAAFHEQLENQHGQAKRVMFWQARHFDQGLSLQLRRSIFRFADRAGINDLVSAAFFPDLKQSPYRSR